MLLSHPSPHGPDEDEVVPGPASSVATVTHEQAFHQPKLWRPKRVLATPAALTFAHGRAIVERSAALGAEVVELKANRLTGLGHDDPRRAYIDAKSTLAVVVAPNKRPAEAAEVVSMGQERAKRRRHESPALGRALSL